MRFKIVILVLFSLVGSQFSYAEPKRFASKPEFLRRSILGKGYPMDITTPSDSNLLFTFKRTATQKGNTIVSRSLFTDPKGKVLVEEITTYKNNELIRVELTKHQKNEKGSLEVSDGKVLFSWSEEGETDTDDEELEAPLLVGDLVTPFIRTNWKRLLKGETLDVRFAALQRKETIGFSFKKEKEITLNGQKVVVIEMKPSSFIIAALVDPLHFTFPSDGGALVEYKGRTSPYKEVDGKLKDLDAYIQYQRK